jgi:ACR3 family arsenite transporter
VVGVLIEVPVMLAAVAVVNRTRSWYERREGVVSTEQCCPDGLLARKAH